MMFRPFRAFRQKSTDSRTQAVGLGCVSSPLRGSFAINSARTPGVQQEMWDTLSPLVEGRPTLRCAPFLASRIAVFGHPRPWAGEGPARAGITRGCILLQSPLPATSLQSGCLQSGRGAVWALAPTASKNPLEHYRQWRNSNPRPTLWLGNPEGRGPQAPKGS